MRIKKLYISAFGGLTDFHLDFDSGLNIFYGDNENGKTTVMTFIKMMFYGTSGRGSDPLKNPRKKYLPWSGEKPAGSITFEFEDKCYTIERQFGNTAATDKISIIDESTGQLINLTSNTDLGLKFFALSESAFERCFFIGQSGAIEENASASTEINQKLANLADTGDQDTSLNTCIGRLEKAKYSIISKGKKTGLYDKNSAELENLNRELDNSRNAELKRKELALKIENEKRAAEDTAKEIQRLTALQKTEQSQKEFEKLNDYIKSLETIESCSSKIILSDGEKADLSFIETAERKIEALENLRNAKTVEEEKFNSLNRQVEDLKSKVDSESVESKKNLENKISELTVSKNETETKISSLNEEIEKTDNDILKIFSKRKNSLIYFILLTVIGAALCLSGILFDFYKLIVIFAGALFIKTGLSLFVINCIKAKRKIPALNDSLIVLKSQLETENSKTKEIDDSINTMRVKLAVIEENSGADYRLLNSKLEDLNAVKKNLEKTESDISEIENFLKSSFKEKVDTNSVNGLKIFLFSIKDYLSKLNKAEIKLNILKTDLGDLTLSQAKDRLKEFKHVSTVNMTAEEIASNLEFKKQKYDEIKNALAFDIAKEKTEFLNFKNPSELEHKIDRLKAEMSKEISFYNATDIAIETLNSAMVQMRKNFGSKIEKRATEILNKITGGTYNDVRISNSLDISVNQSNAFGLKPWYYLSSGTIDQAYFALRLSVSEILSKNSEGFPLFIDDAFCQYDDNRTAETMEFLKEYAKDNQVSFFTCHSSYSKFGNLKKIK